MINKNELPDFDREAFAQFCIGYCWGHGTCRAVYQFRADETHETVVKIEKKGNGQFQNIHEWMIWNHAKNMPEVAKWLVPCIAISNCGSFLLAKRAEKILHHQLPEKVPVFLSDVKPENFGLYNGNVVALDYGRGDFIKRGFSLDMVDAKWI